MKKRLFAILILALAMVLALTSCDFFQDIMDKINPSDEEYTVYFITGDGATYVPNQSVKKGDLVTKPENPTRDGFDFDNWYKDEALTVVWNFETDKVTNHTMIYAKWNEHFHEGGEATCESGPICTKCGKEYGEALGHKGGTATCTEAAVCEVCGESYGDPLGHKGGEANCLVGASCDVCGITYTDPLGHDANDPTCTEASVCDRCGKTLAEALGHIDEDADYVCDRCEEPLEVPVEKTTIMLEITDADLTPSQGPQTVRIGEFEIILSSEKSRIEGSSAKFMVNDEEVKKNYRINFNGDENGYDPATGKWQNAIMFKASGKGSVTIWWYHAGKGSDGDTSAKAYRNVALYDDQGNILAQTNEQYAYKATIITTFEFDAAGTYYISNIAGANNFYYVEVSYEGELVELPELPKYNVHFNTGEGSAVNSLQVEENATVEKPEDPTREGFDFAGWYKDEECTTPWNFSADRITSDTVLYAKWEATYTGEYEDVHYEVNISNLETGKRTEDEINGKFTIVADTEIRNRTKVWTDPENAENTIEFTKSVKIGGNANMIKVSVPGDGKLTFFIQNGSSGVDTQFTKVIAPDGTIYDIEFPAGSQSNPVVKLELDVTEGEWTITRGKNGGTQDIFFVSLDCTVEVSPETGFELVDDGKVDYVTGDELDLSKLVLNATFANGKTEPLTLADVTVDASAFKKDVEGTYTITISYKEYAPISYVVSVFAPVSVELDFDAIEKLANNSAAGNGVYYNHSFRELYFLGEKLDLSGLSVTVVAKCGEATKSFRVTDYEVTGFDASEGGEKELTVTYGGVSATVKVYVSYTEPKADEFGVYNALVDPAYLGPIGDLSGPYHVFNTIQQALDFLAKADPTAQKVITIAPGQYNEKLEITIPNLKIVGVGESSKDVVIEWDSLYGLLDAGGFSHTTDSTATVAIRDAATNVSIENVTISNYWNSQERMDAAGLGIERGLALLVQSDRFTMKDSRLLGIQDTLELFTGRQYFENVYISGYTDFIFGTNNTTYFKNCQIHVIDTVKDDGGTAGYITAFKGSNKGASDSIVYGAIFDGCKFTADEGVMVGKTAIGRPWGAYAAVAVINSELGGHISLAGYSTSKDERYVSMNAKPTDETVQYVEYNNTGAGALTEAVAGMRMLTAEEAALYADFATIFGTTNGNVTYLDPWDPRSTEIVVDDREYYYFNGQEGTSGTSYTYTDNIQGTTGSIGNITIDATVGKVTARASDTQINAGAKLIFNVEAGTLVTVISYPGYGYYTINGIAHNANDTFSVYFAEATEVVIEATKTAYIYQIIINPGEEAPEAATLTEIKVEGMVTDYLVGEEVSLDGVTVNAHYSDFSVRPVEYTVDTSAVNNAVAGEYAVVFTVGNETITVTVKFVSDFAISESTTIDLSATGANIQGTVGTYQGMTIDATNGKFADNGGGWVQVNTGTTITFNVVGEAEVSVNAYSSADNFDIVLVNGVCTITATGNDYLKAIIVKIKVVYGENTTIDLSATGANIQKTVGIYQGLEIDATNGKFADNNGGWTQVNTGTIIRLNVLDGAVVSVTAYSSADNFTVVVENGVCTITAVGNDYLKAITVEYVAVEEPEEINYVLNVGTDITAFAKETKTDGETEVINNFFTIHYGMDSVVESNSKTFSDGFQGTQRFTLGGSASTTKCCVEITVTGNVVVKIWWVSGGDNRQMTVYDGDKNVIVATSESVKNALYITEFELAAGTYYIGGDTGSNYIYQMQVTSAVAGEPEEPETPVEPEQPEEVNHVLNVGTDITAFAKETKTDGETEVINNFFTIHYGKNSVVESNSKTFSDGFQGTQRFTLGGSASTTKCCVEITVTEGSVVKIWWVSGGDNRQMTVYDGDKNVIVATSESVKNALYITEFELAAGTYYIGGDTGSNYIYQMQVTTK